MTSSPDPEKPLPPSPFDPAAAAPAGDVPPLPYPSVRMPPRVHPRPPYAHPCSRVVARLIDVGIGLVIAAVPGVPGWLLLRGGSVPGVAWTLLGFAALAPFAYETVCTVRWGATRGKLMMGLCVVGAPFGVRARRSEAIVRSLLVVLFTLVPVVGLPGFLWCLRDRPMRRAFHDVIAGTMVLAPYDPWPPVPWSRVG